MLTCMANTAQSAETMKAEFQTKPELKPNNKANGDLIRELRNDADITQKELAEELEIHPSYLSDLEHGNRGFSEELFKKAVAAIEKLKK